MHVLHPYDSAKYMTSVFLLRFTNTLLCTQWNLGPWLLSYFCTVCILQNTCSCHYVIVTEGRLKCLAISSPYIEIIFDESDKPIIKSAVSSFSMLTNNHKLHTGDE